jgi:hypothetical protein
LVKAQRQNQSTYSAANDHYIRIFSHVHVQN